jgi:hypothetical protein
VSAEQKEEKTIPHGGQGRRTKKKFTAEHAEFAEKEARQEEESHHRGQRGQGGRKKAKPV